MEAVATSVALFLSGAACAIFAMALALVALPRFMAWVVRTAMPL